MANKGKCKRNKREHRWAGILGAGLSCTGQRAWPGGEGKDKGGMGCTLFQTTSRSIPPETSAITSALQLPVHYNSKPLTCSCQDAMTATTRTVITNTYLWRDVAALPFICCHRFAYLQRRRLLQQRVPATRGRHPCGSRRPCYMRLRAHHARQRCPPARRGTRPRALHHACACRSLRGLQRARAQPRHSRRPRRGPCAPHSLRSLRSLRALHRPCSQ